MPAAQLKFETNLCSGSETRQKTVFITELDCLLVFDRGTEIGVNVRVPWVDITGGQNDFSVGVGFDQFLCKGTGRPVTDGLAVTQKLVPFLAAELADPVVLCVQGIVPHEAVRRVLNTCAHHVVALAIAKTFKGLAESCRLKFVLVSRFRFL